MKRTICLLLCCLAFSLTACGVSQADYDTLVEENSSLKTQVKELETKVDSLSSEKATLESQVASLSSEKEDLESQVDSLSTENESLSATAKSLLDEKTEKVLSELNDSYGKAWATTSFGDNSICFTDADSSYLQCIAGKTYSISEDGISTLWDDYVEAAKTLSVVNMVDNTIPYETISVKFFDPSGIYILDLTLKRIDDSYTLDTIMFNAMHSNEIASVLNKLGSK